MTFREARAITDFWKDFPPESEMLALLARIYTTWRPMSAEVKTPEDHQRSLEERWSSGAMNVKQLFELMGGKQSVSVRIDGTAAPAPDIKFPGA